MLRWPGLVLSFTAALLYQRCVLYVAASGMVGSSARNHAGAHAARRSAVAGQRSVTRITVCGEFLFGRERRPTRVTGCVFQSKALYF